MAGDAPMDGLEDIEECHGVGRLSHSKPARRTRDAGQNPGADQCLKDLQESIPGNIQYRGQFPSAYRSLAGVRGQVGCSSYAQRRRPSHSHGCCSRCVIDWMVSRKCLIHLPPRGSDHNASTQIEGKCQGPRGFSIDPFTLFSSLLSQDQSCYTPESVSTPTDCGLPLRAFSHCLSSPSGRSQAEVA